MTIADVAAVPLSDFDHRAQLRRAVIASTVGTTIEWYDFLLYGQMAALVFAKLYFPSSDPLTGVLQAFAVFAVGSVARPIGAAIFGHYGDRIGRKAALIATLLLTGLSTFLVGCVPTYEQIGVWGAVLLVALRFIQGIGVGGEWGGSVLLSMEWARTSKNRGLIAAWPQFGGPAGFFLANLAILAFSRMSGDQFLAGPHPVTGRYKDPGWQTIGEELQALLTPEEYASARRTTFNAFYTSPTVIAAIRAGAALKRR